MQTFLRVMDRFLRTAMPLTSLSKQSMFASLRSSARFLTSDSVFPKSTIDSEEAVKFRQFASVWWDQHGENPNVLCTS